MIQLHVIQARFGDCFLLEYGGEANPAFMLVDGGPADTFTNYLEPALRELMNGYETIDDIVVSHADNDHIIGVLDLLTKLQRQEDTGGKPFLSAGQLWFNTFNQTIGANGIVNRVANIYQTASVPGLKMQTMGVVLTGMREGSMLLRRADKLRISVNKEAPNGFYLAAKNNGIINRPGLEITVIGPTAGNLKKLQAEWDEWIKKHEQKIAAGQYTREVAANLDRSVPNLSSLVLLIKAGDESLLLAGDCRGDHLQQALIETGLSGDGRFHVNMLKVPHHGSKRNNPPAFLEQVTADTYIFSADGTNDNPDEETLYRIVDVAKTAGRKIRMVFTNETASTTALQGKYPPHELGIQFLAKGKKYLTIKSH